VRTRYHNITPRSPARAAVRDVQDRVHAARLTRSSGVIMRRSLMGTQIQPVAQDTLQARVAQATAGIPRWG
jgi:hypothetical protein